MRSTIETVQDAIFDKKEILKKLICERDELLNRICSNQDQIKNFKNKIEALEVDLKSLSAIEENGRKVGNYGAQNGCNLSQRPEPMNCDNGVRKLQ